VPARLARGHRAQPFTPGHIADCYPKIKRPKRQSYGFGNRDRYRPTMLLGFRPPIPIPLGLTESQAGVDFSGLPW